MIKVNLAEIIEPILEVLTELSHGDPRIDAVRRQLGMMKPPEVNELILDREKLKWIMKQDPRNVSPE